MAFCAGAQEKVVKYYNTDFAEIAKERSMYYYEFVKEGDGYKCTGYYTRTNIIQCKAFYSDTMIGAPSGLQTTYYKNGKIQDSIFYTENGTITEAFHFIESGQLEAHFYTQPNQNGPITDAYDPAGKKIKGYIYGREAQFKGGR
jgi:antitoxin component YwqK of YwqJK toxin-antitoxin module